MISGMHLWRRMDGVEEEPNGMGGKWRFIAGTRTPVEPRVGFGDREVYSTDVQHFYLPRLSVRLEYILQCMHASI